MEEFKGMSRDTMRDKNPAGTWEFARNILLSKGFLSITNEDGFDYKHTIPGIFIGKIETNEEIIYFSVDGNYSCIGLYRTNEDIPVYVPIIRTLYLGFKINRPIEGIFFYNYRSELIIAFCDGVFLDSNVPKIINCTDIGIALDINLELINPSDINQLDLTPKVLTGDIDISYRESGTFEGEVVYVTYAYILGDGITSTPYIPIHTVAYPIEKFRQNAKRDVIIDITKLDTNFNKLKIAILVATEGGLFAYESPIRGYTGDTYNTSLSSLTSYKSISTDVLLIPSVIYNRIKTMTLVNSELVIGNIATDSELNLQKYANLLEVGLRFDTREEEKHNHPLLCPDEAYSITIAGHLLNGGYTKEYHIPGREAIGNETEDLTTGDLVALGIEELGLSETIKRFRVFNTGGFVISAPYCKDVFDAEAELTFGYWQNQENYPNDDNYNSLIDYNGNPITGGSDLRGTPIRYHRMPGLDNLVKNFPCVVGENNRNTDELVGRNDTIFKGAVPAFAIHIKNFEDIIPNEIKVQLQGYKISIVKRTRGDSLVEDICFIKQAYLTNPDIPDFPDDVISFIEDSTVTINAKIATQSLGGDLIAVPETVRQFGFSKIRSTNLLIYTPQVSAKLIKANYGINTRLHGIVDISLADQEIDTLSSTFVEGNVGYANGGDDMPGYTLVPDIQRFAVIKDIKYLPPNNISAKTKWVENGILLTAHNSLVPIVGFPENKIPTRWNPLLWNIDDLPNNSLSGDLEGFNVSGLEGEYTTYSYDTGSCNRVAINATLINMVPNVYSGFNPKDFITIGQVSLRNTIDDYTLQNQILRDGGDIFTNNLYNKIESIYTVFLSAGVIDSLQFSQIVFKGMFGVPNNTEIYMIKDRPYHTPLGVIPAEQLDTYNYQDIKYRKDVFSSLNDLITTIAFNVDDKDINYFPYRVQRSLKVANENLSTYNIRTFPANKYEEMLNDRGEIIALRGSNKILYIQQRFSLFVASIKDRLSGQDSNIYLGEGDIFDRTPDEVMDASNRGYLGSTSQFACILYRDGYVTIDQVKGKIYIISGTQGLEISRNGLIIWFENNSNTDSKYYNLNRLGIKQVVDNPYTQVGHIIGFSVTYNRLLWTKKDYRFKDENLEEGDIFNFDGEYYYINDILKLYNDDFWFEEVSTTMSFSLDNKAWVCEHDYYPNCYAYTSRGIYALSKLSEVYKMNSKINKGTYFGNTFDSYVDLIFNSRLDLSKLYQAIEWNSVCKTLSGATLYNKTIDKIVIYSDYQCSGEIDISEFNTSRNVEGVWNFNEFRDIVINSSLPLVGEEGELINTNLNNNKSFFEKSSFIGTFVVVRLIMSNITSDAIYMNYVNVKSRMSKR